MKHPSNVTSPSATPSAEHISKVKASLWDLAHFLLYIFLQLIYRILQLQTTVPTLLRLYTNLLQPRWTEDQIVVFPPHVAISCPHLSSATPDNKNACPREREEAIASFVFQLFSAGVRHITLYDPVHPIRDSDFCKLLTKIEKIQCNCEKTQSTHCMHIAHVGGSHPKRMTQNLYLASHSHKATCAPTRRKTPIKIEDVHLSFVKPQTGHSTIVHAAQNVIKASQDGDSIVDLPVNEVLERLDAELKQTTLPSEPDVLVVFPALNAPPIPVLHNFPVWYLRLTQIVFVDVAPEQLPIHSLFQKVTFAANAPKRCGR